MYVFEITPRVSGWRLASEGETKGLDFATFAQAERRGRWLAARQDVRGVGAEIRIRDVDGAIVGVWRGERYEIKESAFALGRAA